MMRWGCCCAPANCTASRIETLAEEAGQLYPVLLPSHCPIAIQAMQMSKLYLPSACLGQSQVASSPRSLFNACLSCLTSLPSFLLHHPASLRMQRKCEARPCHTSATVLACSARQALQHIHSLLQSPAWLSLLLLLAMGRPPSASAQPAEVPPLALARFFSGEPWT